MKYVYVFLLINPGLLLVVFSPILPWAIVFCTMGLMLTGAGLSTLIPTVFSSAGHLPDQDTGKAIATVAAFTYSGSILSPPMIGSMSTAFDSLRY
jgi:MFS family permease